MAAISQQVPNLLGGVSQQADPLKLAGQVKESVNAYLDPTFGCRKRPPLQYIKNLASDIPSTAKWFFILRDSLERYAVTIYKNTASPYDMKVRVFDLNSGDERTVTIGSNVNDYIDTDDLNTLSTFTLADFTLIANSKREVSMNQVALTDDPEEALVMINTVAYNTTYSVDLARDGVSTQTKVYKATGLEVTPASYEVADGGLCPNHSATDHSYNHPTDNTKTGLQFRLVNQCSAYFDEASNAYRSRYSASIILKNGGSGWRVGDNFDVTQSGKTFNVRVSSEAFEFTYASDGTATFTTPSNATSGTLKVDDIVNDLKADINNISGYTAESIGHVIKVKRSDTRSFNIAVRGGTTNKAMDVIKGTANDVSKLPSQCFPDFFVKVANTSESTSDDYYVKFVPDAAGIAGTGSWVETVKKGINISFNPSTMPHALIRQANGTFTLDPLNSSGTLGGFSDREVGDTETNPDPSFVGRAISGMTFFANRLGFLSEDAIIMSQAGDFLNFFANSSMTTSDADPIDLTAASDKPAFLKNAIGTQKGLVLFAEHAQFLLATQDVAFAPATVKLTEISNYTYKSAVLPQSLGVSIMFPTETDTYSRVFEMSSDSVDNRPAFAEISRIIPEYIPKDLTFAAASPNNSFVLFGDNSNTIYYFKFYNAGNERQIAGWGKWEHPCQARGYVFDNDTAYVVTYDGTNYGLSKLEMIDDPNNNAIDTGFTKFTPRVDFLQHKADITTSASSNTGKTKVRFANHSYITGKQPIIMFTGSGNTSGEYERPTILTDGTGKYIETDTTNLSGNYVIGLEYQMSVQLPSFFIKQETRADRVDIPMVETLFLDLYHSGRYDVIIKRFGYDDFTFTVEAALASIYEANAPIIEEVITKQVPIYNLGSETTATINAIDPIPSAITGYSFRGHYNKRGIAQLK